MVRNGDHLWGTGVAFEGTVKWRCKPTRKAARKAQQITDLTIYSSRGPRTVDDINRYCPFGNQSSAPPIPTAGDAGFLIPYLFPDHVPRNTWGTPKSNQTCVIPHHEERGNFQFAVAKRQGFKILTVQQSWENMTASLLRCGRVVSSSLHGIIFAEALGLPSRRLVLSGKPGHFKFDDFYESYRADGQPTPHTRSVIEATRNRTVPPLRKDKRDAFARRILETFPVHLFRTVEGIE